MKKLNILLIPVISFFVASCAMQPSEKPRPLDSKTLSGSVWGVDLKAKRKNANSYTISAVSTQANNMKHIVVEAWECAADQLAEGRLYEKSITTKPEYYFIADSGKITHLKKSISTIIYPAGSEERDCDVDVEGVPGGEQHRMWTAHGTMRLK